MSQTEIANYGSTFAILKNIARGKAHAIVQWRIREDEVVEIFIPTIKMRDNIIRAKTTNLQIVLVHRLRRNS